MVATKRPSNPGRLARCLGAALCLAGFASTAAAQDERAPCRGSGTYTGVEIFETLECQGAIRPATQADFDAWAAGANEKRRRQGLKGDVRPRILSDLRYVVLKPFQFPAQDNSFFIQSLIVAPGVPRPSGNLGAATIFFMDDFSCDSTWPTGGRIEVGGFPCVAD